MGILMGKNQKQDAPLTGKQVLELGRTLALAIRNGLNQGLFKSIDVANAVDIISTLISDRELYRNYWIELKEQHKEDFEHSKRYFNELLKDGDKAIKGIVKKLKSYDAWQIVSLCRFLDSLTGRVDFNRTFQRIIAESERRWGSPNYIVCNVLNGTKQKIVSKRTKAYRTIADAVKKAKAKFGGKNRHLSLDGVVSVKDGDNYVAFVSGGNNGHSNWKAYFQSLMMIIEECNDAWIIELDNDSCDDCHYALIGFRTKTRKR